MAAKNHRHIVWNNKKKKIKWNSGMKFENIFILQKLVIPSEESRIL